MRFVLWVSRLWTWQRRRDKIKACQEQSLGAGSLPSWQCFCIEVLISKKKLYGKRKFSNLSSLSLRVVSFFPWGSQMMKPKPRKLQGSAPGYTEIWFLCRAMGAALAYLPSSQNFLCTMSVKGFLPWACSLRIIKMGESFEITGERSAWGI